MPASYDTPQEQKVAASLTESGLRWMDQYQIDRFVVDFWVPELNLVVEADGVYGHLRKRDKWRDDILRENGVEYIFHIKSQTKSGIEEEFCLALETLQTEEIRKSQERVE